jgi:hypothetical protein
MLSWCNAVDYLLTFAGEFVMLCSQFTVCSWAVLQVHDQQCESNDRAGRLAVHGSRHAFSSE